MMEVEITEFEAMDPDELHLVGKGANGFKALLAKSASEEVRAVLDSFAEATDTEIVKADDADDRPDCETCHGDGKIMGNKRKCPKCLGSGKQPKVGDSAKATAPSGAPVPAEPPCTSCKGKGTYVNERGVTEQCPDCGGPVSNPNEIDGFAGSSDTGGDRVSDDGFPGRISDPHAKAAMSGKSQNDLPDSAFAYIEPGGEKDDDGKTTPRDKRHFPVHDEAHAKNALARLSSSPFGDKAKGKVVAAAKKFGIEVAEKNASNQSGGTFDGDCECGCIIKDSVVSGMNPFLGGSVTGAVDDPDSSPAPGSPEWEATDAEIATNAATALMQAAELIQQFAGRESVEVAAGEGNDLFDAWDAECALDAVTCALGVMARLAFHEGVAAQKSADDDLEKKGKRLSTKSITALAAARDHLSTLLGDDDPAKATSDDDAAKSHREIENMEVSELMQLLDERDEARAAKAAEEDVTKIKAGMASAEDQGEAVANAKNANNKAKAKKPKADNTDLEDEADQGDSDSANTSPSGAAKAEKVELTPEQIEARKERKVAKQALKASKRAEKQAAENAAVAKAIKEAVAEATNAVTSLQERIASAEQATEKRLATVEKMAAPGGPAKTRSPELTAKAATRDAVEIRIAALEHTARTTADQDVRKGTLEQIKELRTTLTDN